MKPLSDFSQTSLEHRTSHIDLSSPCDLTPRKARKREGRQDLLKLLDLTDDVGDWGKAGLCLCHHCEHDSGNGWCGNPLHLHIGTWKENWNMRPEKQRQQQARRGADARAKCSYETVKETMRGTVAATDENGNSVRVSVEEARKRGIKMTTSKSCSLTDERTGETHFFPTLRKCAEFLGVHTPAVTRAIAQNRCVSRHFRPKLT